VPEPADGDLAGHGDGGRVDQFFHAGADEGDPEQVAVVFVDNHAGAAGVAVGVQAGPDHRGAGVEVDDADPVPGAFSLVGSKADRPRRRVAEEHLRYRMVVGGDRVRAPRSGVDRLPVGPGGNRGASDAGLVFALVGEQGVVINVTHPGQRVTN